MKLFLFLILVSSIAMAEDFPGGASASEDEFNKGFGADQGMQEADNKNIEIDRLKIGGNLQAEWLIYKLQNQSQKDYVSNPLSMELYFDSQLKNDVRAFVRGRLIHDSAIDETEISPLTGTTLKQNTSSLDEMKISFQTSRKIFWTLGKQKIKWGAAKFWNPTDFLNLQKRDFFKQEDLRAGLSMVKAHIPFGDANLYLISVNEKANESDKTGGAARVEIPFSTFTSGEWSFSSFNQKGQTTRLGSDLSLAIKDVDVYIEAAQDDQGQNKAVSGGLSYEFKYTDDDTASLGVESFWQENGAKDNSEYAARILAGNWTPFFIADSYTLASLFLMKPGSWNDSNIILYFIQNNVDNSQYSRVAWSYTGMTDLLWTLSLGGRNGSDDSEMKYFGLDWDGSINLKVVF